MCGSGGGWDRGMKDKRIRNRNDCLCYVYTCVHVYVWRTRVCVSHHCLSYGLVDLKLCCVMLTRLQSAQRTEAPSGAHAYGGRGREGWLWRSIFFVVDFFLKKLYT